MKIAVYVEGQTELIFIREFLLKWYEYDADRIGIECFEIRNSEAFPTDYTYLAGTPERLYTLINVGCDERALSIALSNAEKHRNVGFDKVLVLRDMYSEQYIRIQGGNRRIDSALCSRFIKGANASISEKGFVDFVFCHFAIMEVEAWILGMGWYLAKHNSFLTPSFLFSELDFDLEKDPEITEYHPARRLKEIYKLAGLDYDKHAGEVNSIMSKLEKTDFELLLELDKCPSFKIFKENLTR